MMKNAPSEPPEILYIADDIVACDGGGGPLGHPRIYMTVDKESHKAECGYCDRVFIQDRAKARLSALGSDAPSDLAPH